VTTCRDTLLPDQSGGGRTGEAAPVASEHWHLVLAYQGSLWHGWQKQPGVRTVQGELESRLRSIFSDTEIRTCGTSRTDAGVHALEQHVSFSTAGNHGLTPAELRQRLDRWLPPDIRVIAAEHADPSFHARHSASAKAYTYTVCVSAHSLPFITPFVWRCGRALHAERMREAARHLTGTMDFAAFAVNPRRSEESTVCTVHRLEIHAVGDLLFLNVIGNRFLYKMVRSIVGYLVLHAGADPAWRPDELKTLLSSGARNPQVQTAPAEGLFLAKVFFEEKAWHEYVPHLPPFAWTP